MRPLTLRFSPIVIAASVGIGFFLPPGMTPTGQAATYVVPTSLASPYYWTAYYPTVYYPSAYYATAAVAAPTAYYVPTTYTYPTVLSRGTLPATTLVTTDYVVDPGVPAYYVPTVSVYPTVLDSYCAPAPVCCDVVAAPPLRVLGPPVAAGAGPSPQVRPLDEAPRGEPAAPNGRRPIPLERNGQAQGQGQGPSPEGGTISSRVKSPPEAPPADRAKTPARNEGAEKKNAAPEPGRDNDTKDLLEPAPPLESSPSRRDSMRPVYSSVQSVLRGRVENDAGDVREGVRITVASRNAPGIAHAGISDAFGVFAIRLEDGDWTVRVTMPSGRMFPIRDISVRDGKVMDNREGREIPNLIITF
jgi:hypothetical protein